jgi:superfamily II DNA or RNA helicase
MNWFSNNGRGTFKWQPVCKTILALAIAVNLFEKIGLQAVVIVCPFRHLVTQWAEESQKFGFEPILAFERRVSWEGLQDNALFNVSQGNRPIVSVITTNATFSSTEFQRKLQYFPQKTFFVADEVHNLGAQNLRQCLPSDVRFRLALSATPERWFDATGTDKLFEYFGPLLEPQLTIKDAIANKALVPYRYFPLLIELSDEERDQYLT